MNFLKGSEWRKWDLQIHALKHEWLQYPNLYESSIQNRVELFLEAAIKNGIEVLAITDHNTGFAIDQAINYAQIKRNQGTNLWVLPGVELDANSAEHLIVIFNEEYKKKINKESWREAIETFLQTVCKITPPFIFNGIAKKVGVPTEDLIKKINREDIGLVIFAHCCSNDGFFQKCGDANKRSNICKNYFTEHGIFIFEIKEPPEKNNVTAKLKGWSINDEKIPIICTSDAHEVAEVGRKFTWIKADPTYEGLRQIIFEPNERIYIDDEPEILKRVRENKTKFIKYLKINQVQGYDGSKGVWFKDIKIPFNPGLVAIIGNKGSGKSAVTDMLGLCGNSHLEKDFSFLRDDRFLKDNLAKNFEAELVWESDEKIRKNLSDKTDHNSPQRVNYIPQNFFEQLTNNLETYDFETTLENIVFSYLPEEEKFKKSSFRDLLNYKKVVLADSIKSLESELSKINEEIIELEKMLHPSYKRNLENQKELREKELEEILKIEPRKPPDPTKDQSLKAELKQLEAEVNKCKEKLKELRKLYENKKEKINKMSIELQEVKVIKEKIIQLKDQIEKFIEENKKKAEQYGLYLNTIIKYNFKLDMIESKINEIESAKLEIERNMQELKKEINETENMTRKLEELLSEPQKKYQEYLENLDNWEKMKEKVIGDEEKPNTLKWYESKIRFIQERLEKEIIQKRKQRLELTKKIYAEKKQIVKLYEKFKKSIEREIESFEQILGYYKITIDASLCLKTNFYSDFLGFINQKVMGSFRGLDEGKRMLESLVRNKNFNEYNDLENFLKEIISYLEEDKREEAKGEKRYIRDQIIREDKWASFYNFLFSLGYLEPVYSLNLGGKEMTTLSPGERGALLVVFYLLLDKSDIPLIIDQPEENLDNESIYKILTHFIKYAKKRRQLILVTHNPNLAIVGDAEQIIFVNIDKFNHNKFSFEAGSIETPIINKHASDVLEGTLNAFDIRRLKYIRRMS